MHLQTMLLLRKAGWLLVLIGAVPVLCTGQAVEEIRDLSSFRDHGVTWQLAGGVRADLEETGTLILSVGEGILVNLPTKRNKGEDIYTRAEYADMDLELEYLMARGSNSGIYLHGRYEIQLYDSWGVATPSFSDNGGIYARRDRSRPVGSRLYEGRPPRQNASRAPGLWQHLKVSFRAPRFDAAGNKIKNAVIEEVILNGVLIHEHVVLSGPTGGAISQDEVAQGPLRFQGDHGPVAFRNIRITRYGPKGMPEPKRVRLTPQQQRRLAGPEVYVKATANTTLRSFMDIPGDTRVVHAISAGSREGVHYTYDIEHGSLFQVWRGGFLDATPMWRWRGDGSSRPYGAGVFLGEPTPGVVPLASIQAEWPSEARGPDFHPLGYTLDKENRPVFRYRIGSENVTDAIRALDDRRGLLREITLSSGNDGGLYHLAARAERIQQVSRNIYLIGDNAWYIRIHDIGKAKPILREKGGKKELIFPIHQQISYSILF